MLLSGIHSKVFADISLPKKIDQKASTNSSDTDWNYFDMEEDKNATISIDSRSDSEVSDSEIENNKLQLTKDLSVNPADVLCGRGKISSNHGKLNLPIVVYTNKTCD